MKGLKIRIKLSLIAAVGSLALAAVAQQTSSVASSGSSGTSNAVVPQLVNYSGVLTDINGKPQNWSGGSHVCSVPGFRRRHAALDGNPKCSAHKGRPLHRDAGL